MDVCARGQEIYDTKYKSVLEPAMNGKYAVIDLATEDISIVERFQSLGNILRPAIRATVPCTSCVSAFPHCLQWVDCRTLLATSMRQGDRLFQSKRQV